MSIDAIIVAGGDADGFRIVRQTEGTKVTYVLEIPKGFDALGCEKWDEVSADGKVVKAMRDFIIRQSARGQETRDAQDIGDAGEQVPETVGRGTSRAVDGSRR